jgi:hypothetical protein
MAYVTQSSAKMGGAVINKCDAITIMVIMLVGARLSTMKPHGVHLWLRNKRKVEAASVDKLNIGWRTTYVRCAMNAENIHWQQSGKLDTNPTQVMQSRHDMMQRCHNTA